MSACAISVILEVFFLEMCQKMHSNRSMLLAISLLGRVPQQPWSAPEAEKVPATVRRSKAVFHHASLMPFHQRSFSRCTMLASCPILPGSSLME